MEVWLRVSEGKVIQVISSDPQGLYPADYEWIHIEDDEQGVQYDWSAEMVDSEWKFYPPPPDVVSEPILFERDWRVSLVAPKILQLRCLSEAGIATDSHKKKLDALKEYVVQLASMEGQDGFPYSYEWPILVD